MRALTQGEVHQSSNVKNQNKTTQQTQPTNQQKKTPQKTKNTQPKQTPTSQVYTNKSRFAWILFPVFMVAVPAMAAGHATSVSDLKGFSQSSEKVSATSLEHLSAEVQPVQLQAHTKPPKYEFWNKFPHFLHLIWLHWKGRL